MATEPATAELSPGEETLSKVDENFFKVESFFNYIAGIVIFMVMIFGVVQVVGRTVFNQPVPSYVDVIEIMMTVFCFLGISYCQKLGGHVRMEIILKRFKGRTFWALEVFGTVVAMLIIGVLLYYSFTHFQRAFLLGDSTIDGDFVLWPSKLLVPVAFGLLSIRLTLNLIGFIRLYRKPTAAPIAVPVIETVDEQAEHEIHMSGADVEDDGTAAQRGSAD
ncbi:MAG: TRAP transporter small permease [Alphaproteobacteria bacterium]|nr:TRAP transporter small permease [Alphaproteobacteria bacterium]